MNLARLPGYEGDIMLQLDKTRPFPCRHLLVHAWMDRTAQRELGKEPGPIKKTFAVSPDAMILLHQGVLTVKSEPAQSFSVSPVLRVELASNV